MIIIRSLILYIIILAFGVFLADKLNKRIENTIVLSLIGITIILYIFGIINMLLIGVYCVSIASILLLIYTIIKNIKNKTIKELKEKVITTGSIFFTIIFFGFMLTSITRELRHWDQFSYWSVATKDMYYTNKIALTTQAITQYPPVPTVLQYFFMKILGKYIQGIESFTTWILAFSFFLPLFKKTNGRKLANIMISAIILCVPAVFSMLIFYESSYPDALLGILIGFISYKYFFEKESKFKNITLFICFIFLTLIKATGVVICFILIFTFLLYEILQKKKFKQIISSNKIKTISIMLLLVIITYMSWCIYLKTIKLNITSVNSIESVAQTQKIQEAMNSLKMTIFGDYDDETINAANSNGKLMEKLYKTTEIYTPIEITIGGLICIYIVITLIFYYKTKVESRKHIKDVAISIFTGLFLYILALQFAYITKFSNNEMLSHAGMERYMASYLLAILYIMICIALDNIKNNKQINNLPYVLLTSIVILITPINSVANATITSGIYNVNTILYCNMGRQRTEKILQEVNTEDKILGICQNKNLQLINLMIRYYMYPNYYKVAEELKENKTIKELLEEQNYNYIYIIESNDYLNKQLYSTFGIENVGKDELYKISGNKLEKINN